jgi:hypothetical protein
VFTGKVGHSFVGETDFTKLLALGHWWSISSTFYGRIFHTKVLFRQNITREKHRHLWKKALLYEKRAHKMLMKLTHGW